MRASFIILGLLAACTGQPDEASTGPRDVVFVMVDTLRADRMSVYGHDRPTTPALDAMAADGLLFRRAYAQSSWTLAASASLFTGLLPSQHGVARDDQDNQRFGRIRAEQRTLAEIMKASGRSTMAVANNTFMAPEFGLDDGFDSYSYRGATPEEHRSGPESVDEGLAWLDAHPEPSFVFLHLMEPHLDYLAPEGIRGRFSRLPGAETPPQALGSPEQRALLLSQARPDEAVLAGLKARYDEEVLATDQAIGRLVQGLRARSRLDQTLLVVTADHGEEFWEHGAFEHGRSLFAETTRVPMLAWGPGLAGGEVDTPVSHVDIFEGVVAQVGGTGPPEGVGTDLFGLALEPDQDRVVLSENCLYTHSCVSVVDRRHRLVLNLDQRSAEVWRVGPDLAEREKVDPAEREALIKPLLGQVQQLRGSLDPLAAPGGLEVRDQETLEMLRRLGYLEPGDRPAAPPEAPPAPSPKVP